MGDLVILADVVRADAGRRLIFVYDLLMGGTMSELCGSARLLSTAELENRRLFVNSERHLTVIPWGGGLVRGVVWDVAAAEAIQLAELLGRSKRVDWFRTFVRSDDEKLLEVDCYAPANHRVGMGSSALVERLRQLAEHHGFPDSYGATVRALVGPGLVDVPPWMRG